MKTRYQHVRDATRRHKASAEDLLATAGADFTSYLEAVRRQVVLDDRPLTLAMAGEYSVGKSSIIKALTGHDVPVGAGVTTEAVRPYPYNDLLLIDMPGTLSGQMAHDAIARSAITDADLILFVVSNELFNRESLPFFMLAAAGLAKKHPMLLVVNKFDRFNLGQRTPDEAARFLGAVLAEEIRPLPLDEFGPVVMSVRDYLASQQGDDPAKAQRRLVASRFPEFIAAIDEFTARGGVLAQQARPLQQLLDILQRATTAALAEDGSRGRAEALVRRRRFVLTGGPKPRAARESPHP